MQNGWFRLRGVGPQLSAQTRKRAAALEYVSYRACGPRHGIISFFACQRHKAVENIDPPARPGLPAKAPIPACTKDRNFNASCQRSVSAISHRTGWAVVLRWKASCAGAEAPAPVVLAARRCERTEMRGDAAGSRAEVGDKTPARSLLRPALHGGPLIADRDPRYPAAGSCPRRPPFSKTVGG